MSLVKKMRIPDGWTLLQHWCKKNNVTYSLIYCRLQRPDCGVTYRRLPSKHLIIPINTDPTPFKQRMTQTHNLESVPVPPGWTLFSLYVRKHRLVYNRAVSWLRIYGIELRKLDSGKRIIPEDTKPPCCQDGYLSKTCPVHAAKPKITGEFCRCGGFIRQYCPKHNTGPIKKIDPAVQDSQD